MHSTKFSRLLVMVSAGAAVFTGDHVAGAERFDCLVRADFFAGFGGDRAAFDRAKKTCEDALARKPKHAEASVWHGSRTFFLSGQAFQKGDFAKGGELWERGLDVCLRNHQAPLRGHYHGAFGAKNWPKRAH